MDIEVAAMRALERVRIFRAKVILTLYLVVAVVTFGHAAAETEARNSKQHCFLTANPQVSVNCRYDQLEFAGGHGAIAGAFWPLYWSWELAS